MHMHIKPALPHLFAGLFDDVLIYSSFDIDAVFA